MNSRWGQVGPLVQVGFDPTLYTLCWFWWLTGTTDTVALSALSGHYLAFMFQLGLNGKACNQPSLKSHLRHNEFMSDATLAVVHGDTVRGNHTWGTDSGSRLKHLRCSKGRSHSSRTCSTRCSTCTRIIPAEMSGCGQTGEGKQSIRHFQSNLYWIWRFTQRLPCQRRLAIAQISGASSSSRENNR